jgi:N-acetylmuramic acid 6-phosphate etherase
MKGSNELITEQRNVKSLLIDRINTKEILEIINQEDQTVAYEIKKYIPVIEKVVNSIVSGIKKGGRLFYIGAGTSGRIGILDASECPPTYGTPPELVQAIIAGGEAAILHAVEGAEDDENLGVLDIGKKNIGKNDVVVGITASGGAPYVIGALKEAKDRGAKTVSFTCNKNAPLNEYGDYKINIEVGPEVISGSTRMKAGTTQKLILNMLTTTTMIKLGKVYQNLMVDLQPSNKKLIERSKKIIRHATNCDTDTATALFHASNGNPKLAIIMHKCQVSLEDAKELINKGDGFVYDAIKIYEGCNESESRSESFN